MSEPTDHSGSCCDWLSLPTWLLLRAIRPALPATHPWKHRPYSLHEWRAGQTDLCRGFDLMLGVSSLTAVISFVMMLVMMLIQLAR